MDISIDLIDHRAKVPGTDPPRIQPQPLPTRVFSVAEHVNAVFKTATRERKPRDYDPLPTANPIIQFLARKEALDLRWAPSWNHISQKYDGDPRPHGKIGAGSLFLNTVHHCFSHHYPLGIRPDALMYMVLHEIGVTVKQNAEDYRALFTTSAEKQLIAVTVNELDIDDPNSPWHLGVERIHAKLRERVPPGIMQWALPGFSTDNLESTTAAMIAFMDAASPFYDYLMRTCCGIPKIRMFGTPDDYKRILVACGQLAERFEKHLGLYFMHLLPVLEKIYAQVSNAEPHDNDFWSSIYNHYSGSGTDDMDGWITAFVNYTFAQGKFHQKHEKLFDWKKNLQRNKNRWGQGINRDIMPAHLSCVPFLWLYSKNHPERAFADEGGVVFDCRLVGGFLGIEDVDGFATPMLSYAVLRGDELKQERTGEGQNQRTTVQRDGGDPVDFGRGTLLW